MPLEFDLIGWAESKAAAGFVATTGITDSGRYQTSGDTQKLRDIQGKIPFLAAGWGASVTAAKYEGARLVHANKILDDIFSGAVRDGRAPHIIGSQLSPKDTITGSLDNANTNEISAIIAAIAYGNPVIYSPVPIAAGGSIIEITSTTDTAGTLPAGWVEAACTWPGLDQNKRYKIISLGGWGTLDVALRLKSNVEGLESGYMPGVPLGATPAMSRITHLAQPYEFPGSTVPTIEIQSLGASAEHHLYAHVV